MRPYPEPVRSRACAPPPGYVRLAILRHLPAERGARRCATARRRSSGSRRDRARPRTARPVRRLARSRRGWVLGRLLRLRPRPVDRTSAPREPTTTSDLPDVAFAAFDARLVVHDDGDRGDRRRRPDRAHPCTAARRRRRGDDALRGRPTRADASFGSSLDRVDHAPPARTCSSCSPRASATRSTSRAGSRRAPRLTRSRLYDALPRSQSCAPRRAAALLDAALPGLAIVSASPELFLRIEPTAAAVAWSRPARSRARRRPGRCSPRARRTGPRT